MESADKPIFTLKYDPLSKFFGLLFPYGIVISILCFIILFLTLDCIKRFSWFGAFIIILLAILTFPLVYVAASILLMEDINIYSDKIVQNFYLMRRREASVCDATIICTSFERKFSEFGHVYIYSCPPHLRLLKGIFFDAYLMNERKLIIFKLCLAKISGRKPDDFRPMAFTFKLKPE